MGNNFPQNNIPQMNQPVERPSIWVSNPHLKMLLLVLIFVFLACGIGLVVFAQVQANYRQKIYEETQADLANLAKHQVKQASFDGRLRVDSPKEGDTVGKTFTVSGIGQDWFEATIAVKVVDDAGVLLYSGSVMLSGDNYGHPAPFNASITLNKTPTSPTGRIEFNDYSAKDGRLAYQKIVHIKFAEYVDSSNTTGWKTYKNVEYGLQFKYPSEFNDQGPSSYYNDYLVWNLFESPTQGNRILLTLNHDDLENIKLSNPEFKNIKSGGREWLIWEEGDTGCVYKIAVTGLNPTQTLGMNFGNCTNPYSPQAINKNDYLITNILSTFKFTIAQGSNQNISNEKICAQVITRARNTVTGEVKDFPTSCLPDGWVVAQ